MAPLDLAAPLGEHTGRAIGSGIEFAGVRPYAAGDRQRDVDWRVSARHGDLYVRQYAAERAFLVAKLRQYDWNVSETARALDMPRSNVYKKIERYGLKREEA